LIKHGLDIEIDAVSEALASASARQTQLFGPQPGRRVERVTEEAPVAGPAHMVLEGLPVRQWVVTLPWSIRRAVAFNSKLSSGLLRAFIRVVHRQLGASAGADARFGAVTVIQRFGGALNLNPHFHTIIPSVAFYKNPDGSVRTEPLPEPTPDDLECILAEFICASQQLLMKHGLDIEIGIGGDRCHPCFIEHRVRNEEACFNPQNYDQDPRFGSRIQAQSVP